MMDDFNSLSLAGARVVLRSVQLSDANMLHQIIDQSREYLERWLPWVDYVHTTDDEIHIVEQWTYDMQIRSAIHLCITLDNKVVGLISTHQIDWMNQRTSIGYWISQNMQGRNLATEATAVLLNYLFEKLRLHRVFIQAATGNTASNKVIRKIGFKLEGVLRENERVKEYYFDHNIYGMTEQDFQNLKPDLLPYLRK